MDARQRGPGRLGGWVLGLLCLAPLAGQAAEKAEILPLVVQEGRCECVLPTARPDDKLFLVIGSLDQSAARHGVTVRTRTTPDAVHVPQAPLTPDPAWTRRVRDVSDRLSRARRSASPTEYAPTQPAKERTFFVFTGDQDFHDPASYTPVKADLKAVGRHGQVYLDRSTPDPSRIKETIDDVLRTFDREVYPRAIETFGHVADVDRDGRFTILLSGCLDRLQNGKTSLGGFVRGSDFDRDLRAPFGNRCDVLYLNTDLTPGPHLRTLLAHEFTHAVIYSEHVLTDYLPDGPRQDEESWLNEGLAHLAEDVHGYGWSNLDYRVSAFLNAPERYPLVVADYYRAGVWRDPGTRGACYLFARWCADHAGPELPTRLTRSNLAGVANLEAATGERFADLFRHWTASLLLSGTGSISDTGLSPLKRIDPRRTLGERLLCGPRFGEMALSRDEQGLEVHGTSAAYLLLHSPGGQRSRLEVSGPPEADLQVTLVRLPAGMGRLSLTWEKSAAGVSLVARACDASLTLNEVSWERVTPASTRDRARIIPARDVFDVKHLKAGDRSRSRPLPIDRAEPVTIKVSAVDDAGHRLAAWIVVSLDSPSPIR